MVLLKGFSKLENDLLSFYLGQKKVSIIMRWLRWQGAVRRSSTICCCFCLNVIEIVLQSPAISVPGHPWCLKLFPSKDHKNVKERHSLGCGKLWVSMSLVLVCWEGHFYPHVDQANTCKKKRQKTTGAAECQFSLLL